MYRKDKGLQIKSLDDPILKKLKIGVHLLGDDYANPPPVHELSKRGIVDNVVGFDTFYSAQNPPSTIIDAVASGKIDVAIVWGPAAGYFVKHQQVPLEMVPVPSGKTDLPFAFDISMGVRPGDDALTSRVGEGARQKARRDHEDPEGLRRASPRWKGRARNDVESRVGDCRARPAIGMPSHGRRVPWLPQLRRQAPAAKSQELYKNVYNGWKMVARLLLPMPRDGRRRHDARARI